MSSRCGQEQLYLYEKLIDQFLFSFTGQQTVGVCRNNYIQRIFFIQRHFYQVDHHQVPKLIVQIVLINPRIIQHQF
jgi:hypothetical protein